ncbi:metal-dependent hydrolase [Paenibacillus sinopodophylli]|uniref:metal-dependent hydrolase n=1 Tax=Paenibacillus sinopodophylli TaxID=1837342 RepID=UPI001486E544|nr:metal-dependent hydrolase [Paenibacillus sinopodophylli]
MNKAGHVALGVAAGSVLLSFWPSGAITSSVVYILAVAVGSLAPDLDHKTSTASNLIQLSTKNRRFAQSLGSLLLLLAAALWGLPRLGIEVDEGWVRSAPLWAAAGAMSFLLAKLRSLVLLGVGALLLAAYAIYDWHWFTALAGGALLLLPMVKHRGIIHTPEFALALSVGAYAYAQQSELWMVQAISMGLIVGWWAHLVGDLFGREGISSLFSKRVHLAFRLFDNGGIGERMLAKLCWGVSILCWILLVVPVSWKIDRLSALFL